MSITLEELRWFILYHCDGHINNMADQIYNEIADKLNTNIEGVGNYLESIAIKLNELDISEVPLTLKMIREILLKYRREYYYACYTTALDTFLSLGTISSKIREDAGLRKIFLGELCDLLEHYKPSIRYKVGRIIDNLTGKQRIGHVGNQTDSYQYWENIDIKKLKNDNDIL